MISLDKQNFGGGGNPPRPLTRPPIPVGVWLQTADYKITPSATCFE